MLMDPYVHAEMNKSNANTTGTKAFFQRSAYQNKQIDATKLPSSTLHPMQQRLSRRHRLPSTVVVALQNFKTIRA